jgi:hypothetical protein
MAVMLQAGSQHYSRSLHPGRRIDAIPGQLQQQKRWHMWRQRPRKAWRWPVCNFVPTILGSH